MNVNLVIKLALLFVVVCCLVDDASGGDNIFPTIRVPTIRVPTIRVPTYVASKGQKGQKGSRGYTGPKGSKGSRGYSYTGSKGQKGSRGSSFYGSKGSRGPPGPPGSKGSRGPPGPISRPYVIRGPPGPPGPRGPKGNNGTKGSEIPGGLQQQLQLNDEKTTTKLQTINETMAATVEDIQLQIQLSENNTAAELKAVTSAISELQKQVQLNDENTAAKLQTVDQKLTDSLIGIQRDIQLNSENILNMVSTELQTIYKNFATNADSLRQQVLTSVLQILNGQSKMCGIVGNWRRIAYFDTMQGDFCPIGLRTVTNTSTNQTACGRIVDGSCTPLTFTSGSAYSNVCGRIRGYQFGCTSAFEQSVQHPLKGPYVDGVSITQGHPMAYRHLWTYAVGQSEEAQQNSSCPCVGSDPDADVSVPDYVGEHYYCESGSVTDCEDHVAWDDPLWDGSGCVLPGNQCCNHDGWFHRKVPLSSDAIEVRWCGDGDRTDEDILTDQLEIWVM